MFETDDFKNKLREVVVQEARESHLAHYEREIIDTLQQRASANERDLMERELRKTASERRGMRDALNSAAILARNACAHATAEKRDTLTAADVEAVYKAKFCQFWPFCKS